MEHVNSPAMGAVRMWRNPPVRRLALMLAAIFILAALLLWLFAIHSSNQLQQDWLDEQTAIIGRLSAADPELAREWAALLAKPESLDPGQAEKGRQLAEQYGLTDQLDASWSPVLQRYSGRTLLLLGGGLAAFILLAGLGLFLEYRRQLSDIRKLAVSLENTVKHNQPMSFRLYGEGEIGLLANSVQELALRLQQTIGQLQRDKDFLKDTVADISHQLKTPLASLLIYTDLLRQGNLDPDAQQEFLETCRRELDRMEWLILTLLKIARLEADALQLHIRPAPLENTVRQARQAVLRLADEKNVKLAIHGPAAQETAVPHDPRWIGEAVTNLLKNAVEHSPPKGTVTLEWDVTPVFLRLAVQDQGPGIEEKHLPHIFRKFYRASRHGSGAGLGLSLAKSIVERHGGMLSASTLPEGGSRFVLTLPLHPLPPAPIAKSYNFVRNDPVEL